MSLSSLKAKRPLSPHLQIYRPQLTSVLSILHRLTGVVLYLVTLALSLGVVILATWPDITQTFLTLLQSSFIYVLWGGVVASFYYHLFNGIRHLMWDAGKGYALNQVYRSGYLVVGLTTFCTLINLYFLWNGGCF